MQIHLGWNALKHKLNIPIIWNYHQDVMTVIATRMVLGIDELLGRPATTKINISLEALK